MLDHMKNVSQTSTPHKRGLGDDERQPEGLDPETQEADQPYPNSGKPQLHLKTAVQRPANPDGDLICVDDMTEQAAHNCEPAGQADGINGDDLYCTFPAFLVPGGQQMNCSRDDRDHNLEIDIQTRDFK